MEIYRMEKSPLNKSKKSNTIRNDQKLCQNQNINKNTYVKESYNFL